jgi:uncharacterized membrane protein
VKINFKKAAFTSFIALLPMILGIVLLPQLPEQVAVHWSTNQTPDSWMSKHLAVFGIPSFMAMLQFAVCVTTDVKAVNGKSKIDRLFLWVIPVLSFIAFPMTMFHALGAQVDVDLIAKLLLGIVFLLIGNYMPKIPQEQNNSLYAKNLPPEKYRKGMKIMGILFFVMGILILASMFFFDAMLPVIMGTGLLAVLVFFFCYMQK